MRTLMEDLLSAGSIQSGHFVVAPRPTPLRGIVEEAIEIAQPWIISRGQVLELDLPPDGVAVLADLRYARQVLSNLLHNASKYSPEQSIIHVEAKPTGTMMRIAVADQG